ncbi:unnamed protein product [Heterobilharzia americana]|nr:unnamed protein product [Heterobilharzia americana]CAH8568046.1 unnamed protein product [Heterobilharzia americana]
MSGLYKLFSKALRTVMSILQSTEVTTLKKALPSETKTDDSVFCVDESSARLRRKKCAVLMMYSGWGFYGMQRCPVFPTIEGELSKALFACGQLSNVTGEEHKKVHFQRASKTDKSVSALGQVCSIQLKGDDDLLNKLNTALPESIRILDIIRVTRCFSAQADQVVQANNLLARYKGTHNFYNFTSGRLSTDKSCYRYIMSAECMPVFLLGDHEYTLIRITGQSFMLHQIRKMIGLVLAVLRGYAQEDVFDIAFQNERVDIPKAPGLGLMLNHVDFTTYNQKYQNDGIHEPIDWSKYDEQRDEFKLQHIYKHIDQVEVEEKSNGR